MKGIRDFMQSWFRIVWNRNYVEQARYTRPAWVLEDLKASAALKRERKQKKRYWDNHWCLANNPCRN